MIPHVLDYLMVSELDVTALNVASDPIVDSLGVTLQFPQVFKVSRWIAAITAQYSSSPHLTE